MLNAKHQLEFTQPAQAPAPQIRTAPVILTTQDSQRHW